MIMREALTRKGSNENPDTLYQGGKDSLLYRSAKRANTILLYDKIKRGTDSIFQNLNEY